LIHLLLAGALLVSPDADVVPFPDYDVVATCKSAESEKDCVSNQYGVRILTTSEWRDLSVAQQKTCIDQNKWSDYTILFGCVHAYHEMDKPN
jgi:hypothetical protein